MSENAATVYELRKLSLIHISLEEIEREVIRFAIAHYDQQMSEVARRLKIGRSTLYRKLDGLGLTEEAPAAEAETKTESEKV